MRSVLLASSLAPLRTRMSRLVVLHKSQPLADEVLWEAGKRFSPRTRRSAPTAFSADRKPVRAIDAGPWREPWGCEGSLSSILVRSPSGAIEHFTLEMRRFRVGEDESGKDGEAGNPVGCRCSQTKPGEAAASGNVAFQA